MCLPYPFTENSIPFLQLQSDFNTDLSQHVVIDLYLTGANSIHIIGTNLPQVSAITVFHADERSSVHLVILQPFGDVQSPNNVRMAESLQDLQLQMPSIQDLPTEVQESTFFQDNLLSCDL